MIVVRASSQHHDIMKNKAWTSQTWHQSDFKGQDSYENSFNVDILRCRLCLDVKITQETKMPENTSAYGRGFNTRWSYRFMNGIDEDRFVSLIFSIRNSACSPSSHWRFKTILIDSTTLTRTWTGYEDYSPKFTW